MDAQVAYARGAATWNAYAEAKNGGASSEEAAGQVAGSIAGAGGCVAAGAGFAAPLCASVGGTLGKALGGLLGGGSSADRSNDVCIEVGRGLDGLVADAAKAGLTVDRGRLQAMFADAANRAWLDHISQGVSPIVGHPRIVGEMGRPGASVAGLAGRPFVQLQADGLPKPSPSVPWTSQQLSMYQFALPFRPVGTCLWENVRVDDTAPLLRAAGVGLAAVGARIVSEGTPRNPVVEWVVGSAAVGAVGLLLRALWKGMR